MWHPVKLSSWFCHHFVPQKDIPILAQCSNALGVTSTKWMSLNEVQCFLAIFDHLINLIWPKCPIFRVILNFPTYPKIGRNFWTFPNCKRELTPISFCWLFFCEIQKGLDPSVYPASFFQILPHVPLSYVVWQFRYRTIIFRDLIFCSGSDFPFLPFSLFLQHWN